MLNSQDADTSSSLPVLKHPLRRYLLMSVNSSLATFAAGCFWGTEHFFVRKFKDAILSHEVGFMGGKDADAVPYTEVKKGNTGHAEVLQITYDTTKVSYHDLLAYFFRMHNSTTLNRQEGDVGTQYRSAIFYHNEDQLAQATEYINKLNGSDEELHAAFIKAFGESATCVTRLEAEGKFYKAEDYHQNYLVENPDGYCAHRMYF